VAVVAVVQEGKTELMAEHLLYFHLLQ
jgi:hypothetical protein